MHLIETYALQCGCQIDKCWIDEEPIDLPVNKFITFHGYNPKGNSKQYDHWPIVLNMLKTNTSFCYDIIQIGQDNDYKYDVNTDYLGATNYNSLAFLIKHASLHLGFDSLPVHLASMYGIKIVALYSYYAKSCGPYFSNPSDIKIFEPDYSKYKPTPNIHDPHRLINTINPQIVYSAICELLGIPS